MNQFSSLGLSEPLLRVLEDLGFTEPTPIQAKAIPILIDAGQDFIGLAQTGTGKTAAFGLPLIDLVDTSQKAIQALVLAPTRELGQQIGSQLKQFSKHKKGLRVETVYGGAAITGQIKALRDTPHILIATPGRLIDLAKRKAVKLENVNFLVLDEADEMLTMGFKEELDTILSFTPEEKHTWLFSATLSSEIRRISKTYMNEPAEVSVNQAGVVNKNIAHQYMVVRTAEKVQILRRFVDADPDLRAIVFCRTRLGCQDVAKQLIDMKLNVEALHGDMNQSQRDRVMQRFKAHSLQMLIATDVAARGIDVNDLTHVFHFNLPDGHEFYTHRSGRTARAGKKGVSLALISSRERSKIRYLEKDLKITFEQAELPSGEELLNMRMIDWTARLLKEEQEVKIPAEMLENAQAALAPLSKEQLVERLLVQEFGGLIRQEERLATKAREDRAARKERSVRERDDSFSSGDGRRPAGKEDKDMVRFFINVGKMDNLTKQEMIGFLVHETGLSKGDIGKVDILQKHSLFYVKEGVSKKIVPSFKSVQIGDRKLRVSRDDDGGTKSKFSKKSSGKYDKRPGKRGRD